MDTYNTDEELEKLKSWWKSYGASVITGIVLGVTLLGGITYWKQYKTERASQASELYDKLVASATQNNAAGVSDAGSKLVKDYSATVYAGKAALIMAKFSYTAADMDATRKHLQWALDHATESATKQTARLRLARVLIEQHALDQAWLLATAGDTGGFASEYAELRGDILLAQDKKAEARSAYVKALEDMTKGSAYERVLRMKLDDLSPDKAVVQSEPAK